MRDRPHHHLHRQIVRLLLEPQLLVLRLIVSPSPTWITDSVFRRAIDDCAETWLRLVALVEPLFMYHCRSWLASASGGLSEMVVESNPLSECPPKSLTMADLMAITGWDWSTSSVISALFPNTVKRMDCR